jgi:hypothetical protein
MARVRPALRNIPTPNPTANRHDESDNQKCGQPPIVCGQSTILCAERKKYAVRTMVKSTLYIFYQKRLNKLMKTMWWRTTSDDDEQYCIAVAL